MKLYQKIIICLLPIFVSGHVVQTVALGQVAATQANVTVSDESLDGTWEVSIDGGKSYQPVRVPGPIEDQLDPTFDGISRYRKRVDAPMVPEGQRLWLEFDAAATRAIVKVNGEVVGEHLGGWTPFACEITAVARAAQAAGTPLQIEVELDELVGHNTQGFLPVLIPHFGGLWQSARLALRPETAIVRQAIQAVGDAQRQELHLDIPVVGVDRGEDLSVDCTLVPLPLMNSNRPSPIAPAASQPAMVARFAGREHWQPELETRIALSPDSLSRGRLQARWTLPSVQAWSPANPRLYELRLELKRGELILDRYSMRCAFRTVTAAGHRLELNGRTVVIRGVLNWGYAPPSFAPSLDETWMRQEIEFAKARGFNLMKFCLWVPPRRYLELCDELGMLAWMEYPTWHPKLDQQHLPDLQREYDEFFQYDRNHPSVILRSLTCETGPSADIEVIRELYQRCKRAIPGALVEDDSSWISWNRVHDFYDDHPYGNNHTWVDTLKKLTDYIAERDAKPLVLGEAIAADSWWIGPDRVEEGAANLSSSAAWLQSNSLHAPWFAESNRQWQEQMRLVAERHALVFPAEELTALSLRYGQLMRKFQIETYRREVPWGGYVVSVIRDFPKAAMGLIGFDGQSKSLPEDWQFHRDRLIVLETERDARSFESGSPIRLSFHLRNAAAEPVDRGELTIKLRTRDGSKTYDELTVHGTPVVAPEALPAPLPVELSKLDVDQPTPLLIEATWKSDRTVATNEWPIWVFPAMDPERWLSIKIEGNHGIAADGNAFLVADQLTPELLERIGKGTLCWLTATGKQHSFPVSQHWFLRGAPVAMTPNNWTAEQANQWQMMMSELQHFDLAGPVVPHIGHYANRVIPKLLLWDNHDMRETRTHAVAMEIPIGRGRLLVTTINTESPAGRYVLDQWLSQMAATTENQLAATAELGTENLNSLRREINHRGLELHTKNWKFQPDPDQQGLSKNWHQAEFDAAAWPEIRADRHWEGQGYAALDGWAWYRLTVDIPETWSSDHYYLNLGGVDDHCRIYLNGERVGEMGDIEKRLTAFDSPRSFDVTPWVKPGKPLSIAIEVYDWFGAGGLFKPMSLSTEPTSESPPWLR